MSHPWRSSKTMILFLPRCQGSHQNISWQGPNFLVVVGVGATEVCFRCRKLKDYQTISMVAVVGVVSVVLVVAVLVV